MIMDPFCDFCGAAGKFIDIIRTAPPQPPPSIFGRLKIMWQNISLSDTQTNFLEITLRVCGACIATYICTRMLTSIFDPSAEKKNESERKTAEIMKRLGRKDKSLHLTKYELAIAAELVTASEMDKSWMDVGGQDHLIKEISETLLLPMQLKGRNLSGLVTPPKGVLLYGPPGCGKTLIAKALAKAVNARFLNLQISSLVNKWYGESQKLTAAVFSLAKKLQPTIIFIDEIDGFLRSRTEFDHEATALMKTQFMTLWDGFVADSSAQVIIVGASNRPSSIDPAILRRMPARFHVQLPDHNQRQSILEVILRDEQLEEGMDLSSVAEVTEDFSGSDLKEVCRLAAINRIKEQMKEIDESGMVSERPLQLHELLLGVEKMDVSKIPPELRLWVETHHVYGTAGFRDKATELPIVVFRMGVLAVLRSKAKKAVVGVMITASHNPEGDNGVKLIDPNGEMMTQSWEQYATLIANAKDTDLPTIIACIKREENIDDSETGDVYCAFDMRSSSIALHNALRDGVTAIDGEFTSFGLLTTPQLHYIVRCTNTSERYGIATEYGYYSKLSKAFLALNLPLNSSGKSMVYVDGANGVGGIKMKDLATSVASALKIMVVNCGEGKLNDKCGADYVKLLRKPPVVHRSVVIKPGQRWASVDGDGDRLVYYYMDQDNMFHLLDGDKIATLVSVYIGELIREAGLPQDDIKTGIVQTAYANGSSTKFIENVLKLPVFCVPTGVKYLHEKASQLDIGVYFEANGHGTVLFSDRFKYLLDSHIKNEKEASSQRATASKRLQLMIDLVNECTGDALSDLLLVETVLAAKNWTVKDWDSLYNDMPCKQLKVTVKDRRVITTTDAERRCVTPKGLQEGIDEIVKKHASARTFVRPSGTEDIVRIYAEANTTEAAEKIANDVSTLVKNLIGKE